MRDWMETRGFSGADWCAGKFPGTFDLVAPGFSISIEGQDSSSAMVLSRGILGDEERDGGALSEEIRALWETCSESEREVGWGRPGYHKIGITV